MRTGGPFSGPETCQIAPAKPLQTRVRRLTDSTAVERLVHLAFLLGPTVQSPSGHSRLPCLAFVLRLQAITTDTHRACLRRKRGPPIIHRLDAAVGAPSCLIIRHELYGGMLMRLAACHRGRGLAVARASPVPSSPSSRKLPCPLPTAAHAPAYHVLYGADGAVGPSASCSHAGRIQPKQACMGPSPTALCCFPARRLTHS